MLLGLNNDTNMFISYCWSHCLILAILTGAYLAKRAKNCRSSIISHTNKKMIKTRRRACKWVELDQFKYKIDVSSKVICYKHWSPSEK